MARLDWNRIQTELAEAQRRQVAPLAPRVAGPGIAESDRPAIPCDTLQCATAPRIARGWTGDDGADHLQGAEALLDHIALALAENTDPEY